MSVTKELYGEEYKNRDETFKQGVEDIETRHIDFFKKRESRLTQDPHDKLRNHFIIYTGKGRISIGFDKQSDVPQHIQNEVLELFEQIWNPSK